MQVSKKLNKELMQHVATLSAAHSGNTSSMDDLGGGCEGTKRLQGNAMRSEAVTRAGATQESRLTHITSSASPALGLVEPHPRIPCILPGSLAASTTHSFKRVMSGRTGNHAMSIVKPGNWSRKLTLKVGTGRQIRLR